MDKEKLEELERIKELRKSRVRRVVTYSAAAFLFGGGSVRGDGN